MKIYRELKNKYTNEAENLKKRYNTISLFRLASIVLLLFSAFYYIKTNSIIYAVSAAIMLSVFLILMRIHGNISKQKKFSETLISINDQEIIYLESKKNPFANGNEFNDFTHPYAYDLDIFGEHSLFQNLNRTNTFIGKKTLATQLLTLLPNNQIQENHDAIKEVAQKLNWRQEFMAFAKISNDTKSLYDTLIKWSKAPSAPLSKASIILSFLAPTLFVLSIIGYLVTKNPILASCSSFMFVFNLTILGKFYKRIAIEIFNAENIDKIITQYELIVQQIEKETFTSQKLIDLQQKLKYKNENASQHLKELSALFSKMDSIGNFVTTLLFNGTFLFHLHTLKSLIQWKKENAEALEQWLQIIGELEMLNSLANLTYNNPEFVFPVLNQDFQISFTNLSHPLLNKTTRIGNDVDFQPQSFMILTGSNMSGKSTFLRSLGINMVLAGIGSSVCASKANIHPLPVLVSMRLSDSLSDSESYFYAEIKRLKLIMDNLKNKRAFVLLDEILRGTNSDDKRSGTIEVVKKMIGKNAIGAIATHDIEVCHTTNDYPNQLTNKCFEVEIINNDLNFDYKLRDGICKNKSATFLMRKMEII